MTIISVPQNRIINVYDSRIANFIGYARNEAKCIYSFDGQEWLPSTTDISVSARNACWAGDRWIVVGDNLSPGQYLQSANGINGWEIASTGLTNTLNGYFFCTYFFHSYLQEYCLVMGGQGTNCVHFYNGSTWSELPVDINQITGDFPSKCIHATLGRFIGEGLYFTTYYGKNLIQIPVTNSGTGFGTPISMPLNFTASMTALGIGYLPKAATSSGDGCILVGNYINTESNGVRLFRADNALYTLTAPAAMIGDFACYSTITAGASYVVATNVGTNQFLYSSGPWNTPTGSASFELREIPSSDIYFTCIQVGLNSYFLGQNTVARSLNGRTFSIFTHGQNYSSTTPTFAFASRLFS